MLCSVAMNLAVVGHKGGVGKTVTAVHLAGYLQTHGSTLLVDGDPNRSASGWAARGSLPFPVVEAGHVEARAYEHVVYDTEARPHPRDLQALADRCDLLVLPTTPDALALAALAGTIDMLRALHITRFWVLLAIVPPLPSRDGAQARLTVAAWQVPILRRQIRRLVAFQKAALIGRLVGDVPDDRRASWGAADYLAVGKELMR